MNPSLPTQSRPGGVGPVFHQTHLPSALHNAGCTSAPTLCTQCCVRKERLQAACLCQGALLQAELRQWRKRCCVPGWIALRVD